MAPRIIANSPTTKPISAIAPTPAFAFGPTKLSMVKAADMEVSKIASDPAVSIASSMSKIAMIPSITDKIATAPTNGASFPTSLFVSFSKLAEAVISENAVITAANAIADDNNLSVSATNESATNATARTPTAATKATIEPTLAVAPFDA